MTRIEVVGVVVGAVVSIGAGGTLLTGCRGSDDTGSSIAEGGGTDGSAPPDATSSETGSATSDSAPASDAPSPSDEGSSSYSAGPPPPDEPDGDGVPVDAGGPAEADAPGDAAAASRFVTGVVQFNPTGCTGFGASSLPGIVEGPPVGGGTTHGSTDVVSLGSGGSIVVTFAPNAIVDGPGPDFIVFENPFWVGGNSNDVYAEPGEVSVSDDGVTWVPFPCSPTFDAGAPYGTGVVPPYGACAGWGVVYSTPENGISPFDPATAGGNAYDLADIGVTHANFVRIVDRTAEACPEGGAAPNTNGFDLDAIAIINAELP
jgi:hypothetical protein